MYHILNYLSGLKLFYYSYSPQIVAITKPLRELQRHLLWISIPPLACTSVLLQIFIDSKIWLTSSDVPEKKYWHKPTILKADRIERGMSWIITQTANDHKYFKVMHILLTDGTLIFDLESDGPRLWNVHCGSFVYIDI